MIPLSAWLLREKDLELHLLLFFPHLPHQSIGKFCRLCSKTCAESVCLFPFLLFHPRLPSYPWILAQILNSSLYLPTAAQVIFLSCKSDHLLHPFAESLPAAPTAFRIKQKLLTGLWRLLFCPCNLSDFLSFSFLKFLLWKKVNTYKSRPNIKKNPFVPIIIINSWSVIIILHNNNSVIINSWSALFLLYLHLLPPTRYFEANSRHLILSSINSFNVYKIQTLKKIKYNHNTIIIPKTVNTSCLMASNIKSVFNVQLSHKCHFFFFYCLFDSGSQ